MIQISSKA